MDANLSLHYSIFLHCESLHLCTSEKLWESCGAVGTGLVGEWVGGPCRGFYGGSHGGRMGLWGSVGLMWAVSGGGV